MVGYDSQNNALTLGDDDSLKVGEYELQYDSTSDEFQAEYEPTGDTKSIPRSTSGSLVPQGFADVVSQGEVLADNGEIYTSVQTAVNNSSGFVFVGPGTFNESVTIDTAGLTLVGAGVDTEISPTTGTAITVGASNTTIKNISCRSEDDYAVYTTYSGTTIKNITASTDVTDGIDGIYAKDTTIVSNCTILESGDNGIYFNDHQSSIAHSNNIENANRGIYMERGGGYIASANVITNPRFAGIAFNTSGSDNVAIGNRVHTSDDVGIIVNGAGNYDNIVANNRVSDSTNADIDDSGSGTVLDDNLTGPSN